MHVVIMHRIIKIQSVIKSILSISVLHSTHAQLIIYFVCDNCCNSSGGVGGNGLLLVIAVPLRDIVGVY